MSEPSVAHLVRDLAEETTVWVRAEVHQARRDLHVRAAEVKAASLRWALVFALVVVGLLLVLGGASLMAGAALGFGAATSLVLGGSATLACTGVMATAFAVLSKSAVSSSGGLVP